MITKQCRNCREVLSVDSFHKHPYGAQGVGTRCKVCERAWQKMHAAKPDVAERKRRLSAEYRARHADDIRDKAHARYVSNTARRMWTSAKSSAASRGLEFDLVVEDIVVPEACPVFGVPFEHGAGKALDASASLDRIDSSRGYVRGNVWVISWRANRLKSDASLAELETLCAALRARTY